MGYQPNKNSFFRYSISYSPKNANEKYLIDNRTQNTNTEFFQKNDNKGYKLSKQFSYVTKVSKRTFCLNSRD